MRIFFKKISTLLIIFLVVELFYSFFNKNFVLPPPSEILASFIGQMIDGTLVFHIFSSLLRVGVGYLLAVIVAVPLAIICIRFPTLDVILKPIVEILRPIPPIAWIPLSILFFGLGNFSAYFIVFVGSFFPIFSNTYFGASSLPTIYKRVASSFEINNKSYVKNILFKYSLPYIFAGLKIGMGMAWMSVIAAELIGAQSGLGYYIQLNRLLLRFDNIIIGMALIGLIGYILTKIVSFLEVYFMPWTNEDKDI